MIYLSSKLIVIIVDLCIIFLIVIVVIARIIDACFYFIDWKCFCTIGLEIATIARCMC